jgi:UPF0271 protein
MDPIPQSAEEQEPSRSIDLNADLAEGFTNDRALLERVSSASLCCGAHAGDPEVIRRTLREAAECKAVLGAHPGYADREGFGRRDQKLSSHEVETLILNQVSAIRKLADERHLEIRFLKPHGALYNQAQREPEIALGVLGAVMRLKLPLMGQPGTLLESMAKDQGVRYIAEGFPDRRYRPDGSLVPRKEPDAVLKNLDEIEAQVVRFLNERKVATLCVHGDEPHAVANADRVREILDRHQVAVRSVLD